MLKPKRITAPDEAPVSLGDAKLHLRIDHDDENALITSLIDSATEALDGRAGVLGRCLVTQSWCIQFDAFSGRRCVRLPFPDVEAASVVVRYFDVDNAEQIFPETGYSVLEDETGAFLTLKTGVSWPAHHQRPDAVSVTFDAGFGAASAVPSPIKAAILLTVGHLYENREAVSIGGKKSELPLGAKHLLAPYRLVVL